MSSKALLLLLLAGCPNPGSNGDCDYDSECAPNVCARDHLCTPRSNTREVTVRWTVRGAEANAQSCGPNENFTLSFIGDDLGDEISFDPVPCAIGQFFVDLLPKRLHSVELGYGGQRIRINADGTATGDYRP